MQTKSKNHETCRGVVLSHVEARVADMLDDTHQAQFAEGHDKELVGKMFLNYIKSIRSPKITKLIEVSFYRMCRLWLKFEKVSSKNEHDHA